jgi:ligand-binding SRPBCC domain-containing protein
MYLLERTQTLPVSLEEAWGFFSAPGNLAHITPPEMHFEVLSESGNGKLYPGQIITYYVRPLLGWRFFWMTEITHVRDREYFVDEQRMGPYAFWHHTHFFRSVPGLLPAAFRPAGPAGPRAAGAQKAGSYLRFPFPVPGKSF